MPPPISTSPSTQPNPATEADAVAAITRQGCIPHLHEFGTLSVPAVVLPFTGEVRSLELLLDKPRRARAQVSVQDHQSFIEYVTRHKQSGTIIFAEIAETGGSFTAIIDYHKPALPDLDAQTPPQWAEHVCKYGCEFTPEWKRWRELSGKTQAQVKFAQFVEENMFDIADPEPAKMLEIVKTLEATQGAQFKSGIRLDNGDRSFAYTQQTEGRAGSQGEIEIPQRFRLKFAIFTNGPAYVIECRFRWNVDGGLLALGYEIDKPHKLIELALTDEHLAIKQCLNLPVLRGKVQSVNKAEAPR